MAKRGKKKKGGRRFDERYNRWRRRVLFRDRWTCRHCGQPNSYLRAHHIFGWADHKNLRYKVSNGITLCDSCHTDFHTLYGYTGNNNKQLFQWGIIGWGNKDEFGLKIIEKEDDVECLDGYYPLPSHLLPQSLSMEQQRF